MKTEISSNFSLIQRPRRNRKTEAIRSLVRETHLIPSDFVVPLFVIEGEKTAESIESLPSIYRFSIDLLLKEVETLCKKGIKAVDLFPVIAEEKKDLLGSEAVNPDSLLFKAVRALKKQFPDLCVMVDVALDPFTDHGHDGVVDEDGYVNNDQTVDLLARMSLEAAYAGADFIAPSDMMDGRVLAIRQLLDKAGFIDVGILSYTAKYASGLYGPFREALHSCPKFGDKKNYQMDPANRREAVIEAILDVQEGADMLMIKPALSYLDVIATVREKVNLPIGAYHVSGEYAMVKAAAQKGWIDGDKVMKEHLLSIKRAGADFIFTYAAKDLLPMLVD